MGVPKVNENHVGHLQAIDRILLAIYDDGSNKATHAKLFSGKEDSETSKYVMTYFMNPNGDPFSKCLEYLEHEGLIFKVGNDYHLTFKGILRTHGNTFEDEYRNQVASNKLSYTVQTSNIWRNYTSLIISILALILSIFGFVCN